MVHLNCGAEIGLALVEDDLDRFTLLEEVAAEFPDGLLTYFIAVTHAHFVVLIEGGPAEATQRLSRALGRFAAFASPRRDVPLALSKIVALEKEGAAELKFNILYVNRKNAASVPGIVRPLEYTWSGERAFIGLRVSSPAAVERALELLGPKRFSVQSPTLPLLGLGASRFPAAHPEVLGAAVADALSVPPWTLAGAGRAPRERLARAAFLRLARLEGYSLREIAPLIGRSESRASRLLRTAEIDEKLLRIARTLASEPDVARHLPRAPLVARAAAAVPSGSTRVRRTAAHRAWSAERRERQRAAACARAAARLARAGAEGAPVPPAIAPASPLGPE